MFRFSLFLDAIFIRMLKWKILQTWGYTEMQSNVIGDINQDTWCEPWTHVIQVKVNSISGKLKGQRSAGWYPSSVGLNDWYFIHLLIYVFENDNRYINSNIDILIAMHFICPVLSFWINPFSLAWFLTSRDAAGWLAKLATPFFFDLNRHFCRQYP